MTPESRSACLSQEIVRLADRGWELRERSPFEAVMAMAFRGWSPRRVIIAQVALSIVTLGFPGLSMAERERRMLVSVDHAGGIHRRTISQLPPLHRRHGPEWEEPDTDEHPMSAASDDRPDQDSDSDGGISAASSRAVPPRSRGGWIIPSRPVGAAGSLVA
ncbi:hypothetical protein LK09_00305 [Microbacterium mangrovi]|uniref:Uncharacterized protein n=1 Tax=Microbacterium mangrovi TaxID=1348253 RepID=A0A0B2A8F0_9MICO|nr:hypothetical protein [Microbacterium mangrovi]KHK99823.1 hypothetical protein LK09_00305 [Microbacterium mangrovi]